MRLPSVPVARGGFTARRWLAKAYDLRPDIIQIADSSLTIADGATLDPADNALIIDCADQSSAQSILAALNADDYFRMDVAWRLQADGQHSGYRNGDVDYRSGISADDFYLIDQGFVRQATALAAAKPQQNPRRRCADLPDLRNTTGNCHYGSPPTVDPAASTRHNQIMEFDPAQCISYKRARFLTRLPTDRLYTASHFWVWQQGGICRVGFTKFALRMLGDIVEFSFSAKPGQSVNVGETIGWVEGFKALSDVYCVAQGQFVRANPALESDITLLDTEPYGEGWLYEVQGQPQANTVDAQGYIALLDAAIDKLKTGKGSAEGQGA